MLNITFVEPRLADGGCVHKAVQVAHNGSGWINFLFRWAPPFLSYLAEFTEPGFFTGRKIPFYRSKLEIDLLSLFYPHYLKIHSLFSKFFLNNTFFTIKYCTRKPKFLILFNPYILKKFTITKLIFYKKKKILRSNVGM